MACEGGLNVPMALKHLKSKILEGVTLVFSGGILKAEYARAGTPELCPQWALAVASGARCVMTFTDDVTHVVSAKANTASVLKAKARMVHSVTPQWLIDSVTCWKRMPEELYMV